MSDNIEKALRQRLRFVSPKGQLSLNIEDLWHLPLTSRTGETNLDDIARGLHQQLRSGADISFVNPDQKSNETVQLKFDIVKHIIDVRLEERATKMAEEERAEKKQRILALIANKKDKELADLPLDELQKLAASL